MSPSSTIGAPRRMGSVSMNAHRFLAILCLWCIAGMSAATAPFPDGYWRTEGYGEVVHVLPYRFRHFEVTELTCIERESKPRSELATAVGAVVQHTTGGGVEAVTVRRGISRYQWRRLAELPPSCEEPSRPTAASVFETLWHTFAEHYAFFGLRGVDWAETRRKAEAKLADVKTDDDLFALLTDMLAPLADRHVRLNGLGRTFVSGGVASFPPDPDGLTPRHSVLQPALKRYLEAGGIVRSLKSAASDKVWWGWLDGRVGYLALPSLWGLSGQPSSNQDIESAAADAVMDDVLHDLGDARGIVIDLRFNGGGSDAVGLAIAARFADRARRVFSKQARDRTGLTAAYDITLAPGSGSRFLRPVIVLVGPLTASGAEVMALSMAALPNVRLLGNRTMGLFSDTLYRRLPNGWDFTVSNEVYRSPGGEVFEGIGLPPKIASDVSARPDSVDDRFGRDIRRARDLLARDG
jgi:carboxyl-terminal processing protease